MHNLAIAVFGFDKLCLALWFCGVTFNLRSRYEIKKLL